MAASSSSSSIVDEMEIMPLGAGCEVGRSCCIVKYRGSTIMFDCGLHPGKTGLDSLPYFDAVDDLSTVDLLLVTHFHMDHCGAVPYLTEKTNFRGRVFMTHPTKAIFKILQHDAVKVGHDEGRLFDEKDMLAAMDKIELINYHETVEHKGISFTCYNAGHVLGACMFQVTIAGARVLYTGDYSGEEDRHLLGAEIPTEPPHVLIVESTYGVSIHEAQAVREQRFTSAIHQIVARGGRCLIPVFALGRSQELLLILDEYWKAHPELHDVPIFYASKVAKKSMRVYQTYINMMNEHVRGAHAAGANPWEFTHVQNLDFGRGGATALANFDDSRPMVVMASPGMMQNGFSRELFEAWCSDRRNGLMMPGYSVAGTLAHHVMSEPKEITTSTGDKVPVNLSIHYISFSAHSDFAQTSSFIKQLKPTYVVLVHGAEDVMQTLKKELQKQPFCKGIPVYMPGNMQRLTLKFRGERMAKVIGSLASAPPEHGQPLSGLLLKKGFKYSLVAAADLPDATPLSSCSVVQRPTFRYTGGLPALLEAVGALFTINRLPASSADEAVAEPAATAAAAAAAGAAGTAGIAAKTEVVKSEQEAAAAAAAPVVEEEADGLTTHWRVHEELTLTHDAKAGRVVLAWPSGPLNDMLADAVAATILQMQARQLGDGHETTAAAAGLDAPPTTTIKRSAAERRAHVLQRLESHFGAVTEVERGGAVAAKAKSDGGKKAPSTKPALEEEEEMAWQLTACGETVTLYARRMGGDEVEEVVDGDDDGDEGSPFARIVCDTDEARERVARVVELAIGATLPIGEGV